MKISPENRAQLAELDKALRFGIEGNSSPF
jgi:hypothetical protein